MIAPADGLTGEAWRIARFLLVGVLNTAFGYGLYLIGLWAGLAPVVALAAATVIGALFNYFSIGRLVFGVATMEKLPAFAVVYLVAYLFNAALLQALIVAHVAPWLAQILALPPVVAANYGLMRLWVFRSKR